MPTPSRRRPAGRIGPTFIETKLTKPFLDDPAFRADSLGKSKLGGSNTQIFICGVGDFSNSPQDNPGVAFNVDGIYVARPTGVAGISTTWRGSRC